MMEDFRIALTEGKVDAVETLIQSGINIEAMIGLHTPLTLAAEQGQVSCINALISQGVDINKRDLFNNTALMQAGKQGHLDCVKALILAGADINTHSHEWSPLLASANEGHVECFRLLVSKGADVNYRNQHGFSVLHYVLQNSKFDDDLVKEVLDRSAEIDFRSERGLTPLMIATQNGHIFGLKLLLLRGGVNVDEVDKNCRTALMYAAMNGHIACIDELIRSGASVNFLQNYIQPKDEGKLSQKKYRKKPPKVVLTPLMLAAENGNAVCVQRLIEKGANVNLMTTLGYTALTYAAKLGHLTCIQALVIAGADMNGTKSEFNPILIAAREGHIECVKYLMDKGANVKIKTGVQSTLLHLLLSHEKVDHRVLEVVEALIEKGLDPNAKMCDGRTPLMLAAQNCHVECIDLLLSERVGADVNGVSICGESALMLAAMKGHAICIEKLIQKGGADINFVGKFGSTALSCACKFGKLNCVQTLVKEEAIINYNNANVLHPLIIAMQNDEIECVYFLLDNGADPNISDLIGNTVLHTMLDKQTCDFELMKKCLELVTDINIANSHGMTLLMLAAVNEHNSCLKILLEKKASIDVVDKKRWSAIMYASAVGNVIGLRALLGAGANIHSTGKNHCTAFSIAIQRKKIECVKVLGEHIKAKENSETFNINHLLKKCYMRNCPSYDILITLAEYGFVQFNNLLDSMQFRQLVKARICESGSIHFNFKGRILTPFQAAVRYGDEGSFYFILANLFLYEADIRFLFSDVENWKASGKESSNDGRSLVKEITNYPLPLQTLSFITITSNIKPFIMGEKRNEAVDSLPLPGKFKARLKFYNNIARMCPTDWSRIKSESTGIDFLLRADVSDWMENKTRECKTKTCCNGKGFRILSELNESDDSNVDVTWERDESLSDSDDLYNSNNDY